MIKRVDTGSTGPISQDSSSVGEKDTQKTQTVQNQKQESEQDSKNGLVSHATARIA